MRCNSSRYVTANSTVFASYSPRAQSLRCSRQGLSSIQLTHQKPMMNFPIIEPMVLSRLGEPFDHPDWLFELKHDGFRALAYVSRKSCELISRRGNAYKSFGPLKDAFRELRVKNAILD